MKTKNGAELDKFRAKARRLIHRHAIVRANTYTRWFSEGRATMEELRHFTIQFSVFSHLFIEAQLRKCINALDLDSYRASKEILLNELGVTFSETGSVEGGRFTFSAAHFEWLVNFAKHLGLHFRQLGKRSQGSESTLILCQALILWYGSDDWSTAAGASYAIENWAAAGFWKELISGLQRIKASRMPELPLGFWVWHDQLEDQHVAHTDDELSKIFMQDEFSSESFLNGAKSMLDAVAVFWDGLEEDRVSQKAA
jgi:pyrroloquinoline quinone (PQQ) biosynthesis protein C